MLDIIFNICTQSVKYIIVLLLVCKENIVYVYGICSVDIIVRAYISHKTWPNF